MSVRSTSPRPFHTSAQYSSFWAYELSKRVLHCNDDQNLKIMLAGGIAGVVTWASVFPLDVIKTRLQSPDVVAIESRHPAGQPLLEAHSSPEVGAVRIAKEIYRQEGFGGFFRGLGVCSIRAFVVNAVQVSSALVWRRSRTKRSVGGLRVGYASLEIDKKRPTDLSDLHFVNSMHISEYNINRIRAGRDTSPTFLLYLP